MTEANRLKLGKLWKEHPESRPAKVGDGHHYILEYENSIKQKPEPEPKGKRGK